MSARLSIALMLLAGSVQSANAQIYVWQDSAGKMILSDRPRTDGGEVQTFSVPQATGLRVSRPPDKRSARFDPIINEHSKGHGVNPDLVRAVIQVESAFNPQALSPKGAMGLMQLMPATAADFGVVNAFDPEENIRAGVSYLKRLLSRYHGKVELALAAYNAGPGAVDKYGQKVPPYRETRDYVKKITKNGTPGPPPTKIYRWTEVVHGRTVTRYSNKPKSPPKPTPLSREPA